jgi:hypothetical protein
LGDILLQDDDNSFSANINIENFVLRVDAASGKAMPKTDIAEVENAA